MEPIKVLYSIYIKNPKRPSAHYYARVREKDQPLFDVDLKTKDRAQAEAWLRLRRNEIENMNARILLGEPVTEDMLRSLVMWRNRHCSPQETRRIPTMLEASDEFEKHLRRTGRRETTVATYMRAVKALLGPVYANPVTTLDEDEILSRLAAFDARKPNTRKNYSVILHEFVKFAIDRYEIPAKLERAVPRVKVSQEDRTHWDMSEMRAIIDNVVCKDPEQERQYKAFFWLLATAGSRQGESSALLWSDLKAGVLTFRASVTKTRTERRVPLFHYVNEMILALRRSNHGALIFDLLPSQAAKHKVLTKAIARANGKRDAMHKIPAGGLHTFRHSVSVLLYRDRDGQRPDLKAICTMMGHSASVALAYYQNSRDTEEVAGMVNEIYSNEQGMRGPTDDAVEDGLI